MVSCAIMIMCNICQLVPVIVICCKLPSAVVLGCRLLDWSTVDHWVLL